MLVCGLFPSTSGFQIKSPIKTSPQENSMCAHIVREAMYIFLRSSRLPGPFQVHEFMRNFSKSVFTKQETGGEEILKGKDKTGGRGGRGKWSRENVGARMGNFILLIKACKGLVKVLGIAQNGTVLAT